MQIQSTDAATYAVNTDDAIIAQALGILVKRVKTGPIFGRPEDIKNYLRLKLGTLEHAGYGFALIPAALKKALALQRATDAELYFKAETIKAIA
jgi:hypothetical protein